MLTEMSYPSGKSLAPSLTQAPHHPWWPPLPLAPATLRARPFFQVPDSTARSVWLMQVVVSMSSL